MFLSLTFDNFRDLPFCLLPPSPPILPRNRRGPCRGGGQEGEMQLFGRSPRHFFQARMNFPNAECNIVLFWKALWQSPTGTLLGLPPPIELPRLAPFKPGKEGGRERGRRGGGFPYVCKQSRPRRHRRLRRFSQTVQTANRSRFYTTINPTRRFFPSSSPIVNRIWLIRWPSADLHNRH